MQNVLSDVKRASNEQRELKLTLVGEAVPNEPELSLLGVLEDRVEALGF